jgi:hypothetical protein
MRDARRMSRFAAAGIPVDASGWHLYERDVIATVAPAPSGSLQRARLLDDLSFVFL